MVEALQDSPFVISIYNAFQDEDYLYLTMELCEGGDLRRRMGARNHLVVSNQCFCV